MLSVWSAVKLPAFPALSGDMETDVLVIGGGMAGLLCARRLHLAGVDTVLLEADRLCGGVTCNTTAKITSQHGLLYASLLRRFGAEKAGLYLRANEAALAQYRDLCRDIDCDFEEKDNFVYSLTDRKKIRDEFAALAALGYPATLAGELPLPFPVAGAVRFPHQAQFHPLKFAAAMLTGPRIFEHTPVLELKPNAARTAAGTVRAKKIILCTHFPVLNKHGSYFMKLYQHRSYVLTLENAPDVGGMLVDESDSGLSFRNYKDLLLLGGGGRRTGKRGGGWAELEAFAGNYYPAARVKTRWATQDCMTLDGIPYIGPYSARAKDIYVATGFNKWGMTGCMVAAMLLTDAVLGRQNPYAPVFSPSRSMLRPQLALNAMETAVSLLTPTAKRCPHLGCALKWNPAEHSWDCPCHGSRFDGDGRLLDNPATGDLPYKK